MAFDDSPESWSAFGEAVRWARRMRGHVVVMHAISPPPNTAAVPAEEIFTELEEENWRRDFAKAKAKARGISIEGITELGDAADVVPRMAAKAHAEFLVVGTKARKGVARLVLGSTAEAILRNSEVPVLVVPHKTR
jgi:nucleotide-binding universal stress UspA family protein